MDGAKLRAWWSHRQGLDGSLAGAAPADVLKRTGWSRSVGGVGPYLTLFSRAEISKDAAEKAVAKLQIHELPAARGCTYVIPASDFALALKLSQEFEGAEFRVAQKLGVTEKEIDKLCAAVIKALANGPLDPDGIREATGNASRSLGEEGKKKGITTTLPIALGKLQTTGDIRRIPKGGRLDQQRYEYCLWSPNPLTKSKLSAEEAHVELAKRFFGTVGPATLSEFQQFLAVGVKASKKAVEEIGVVPIESGSDLLIFADEAKELQAFKAPSKPQYVLTSSLDPITANRRNVVSLLDPKDAERMVYKEKSSASAGTLTDLPSHAIFDRGRLIGLWEYDPEQQSIAYMTFGIKDKALIAAVEKMEAFLRDELGDARSFSLDSPKSRIPRIEALRKAK